MKETKTKKLAVRGLGAALVAFAGWAVLLVVFGIIDPNVLKSGNILNLLRSMAKYLLVGKFKLPPFIATLGTMFCARGVAYMANNRNTDAILGLIEDGFVLATMAQKPDVMGYEGVRAAVAALNGEDLGGAVTDTGVSVLTK